MTSKEIKIKLKRLIKSNDLALTKSLLEGLNDVDYIKYIIHVTNDCLNKENYWDGISSIRTSSFFTGYFSYIDRINNLTVFKEALQIKYDKMCAEANETTESNGRE